MPQPEWFENWRLIHEGEAKAFPPAVETDAKPPVTAKSEPPVSEPKPEPKPVNDPKPEISPAQSQAVQREHQPWRMPLESSPSIEYLDSAKVCAMLGIDETKLLSISDFAGGNLPSVDFGCGRLYERQAVLNYLRNECEGEAPSPAADAIAAHGLYIQPAKC